jgi:hypothetical protein
MGSLTESFMDKADFIYSERRLAEYLSLPRKMFSDARDRILRKDQEWKNKGGEIALTLKGVLRLLISFDIPESELDLRKCFLESLSEKTEPILLLRAPGDRPTPIKMKVRRLFPNPTRLEAQEVGRTQLYQVIVKSTANFTIGMEFQAIPDPAHPSFWRLHGELPRYRGRW